MLILNLVMKYGELSFSLAATAATIDALAYILAFFVTMDAVLVGS